MTMTDFDKARELLETFKGGSYIHGLGVLATVGEATARLGRRAALVRSGFPGSDGFVRTIEQALADAGVALVGQIGSPAPNAPVEDLLRIAAQLGELAPDVVVSFGGGSNIDAAKAAIVLDVLGDDIEGYFGTGLVTEVLEAQRKALTPHVAIQTASSSAAHLTKYSNITNTATGQKKLIVDEAIVPQQPIFDYTTTFSAPRHLTVDGAMDGVSHALEVLYGAVGKPGYETIEAVASEAIRLVVQYLPGVIERPVDVTGREALGLATDLGGYAIMLGGTNGGHLTSFSLVDVLSHGRACAIMNPYYTVFFAPAIERELKMVGNIFKSYGYSQVDFEALSGRELGVAAAEAMFSLAKAIGFPVTLGEVPGFDDDHIVRALTAAKNPQLKMKLQNMPVPLNADLVDEYMGPILEAAKTGDLQLIRNV
jgi:alcohol dehydrogenase